MDGNVLFAFALTLFAGLATGIGSLLAFFTKRTNTKFLSDSTRVFSGRDDLRITCGNIRKSERCPCFRFRLTNGYWATIAGFFGGMLVIAIIDRLIPAIGNPHEVKSVEDVNAGPTNDEYAKLKKMGMFTALAIAIHNFPEGIATFTSALQDPTLGIAIAIAVAIHNIPEGIAVAYLSILRRVIGNRHSNYHCYQDWQNQLVQS